MFCPKCGKELDENSKFCKHCGEKNSEEEKQEVTIEKVPIKEIPKKLKKQFIYSLVLGIIGCILFIIDSGKFFDRGDLGLIATIGLIFVGVAIIWAIAVQFIISWKQKTDSKGVVSEEQKKKNRDSAIGGIIVLLLLVGFIYITQSDNSSTTSTPPAEIVSNSAWDGSVSQVKSWLKKNLKDPGSLEFIEWFKVVKNSDGGFMVKVKYRAKNSFGGYVVETKLFALDSSGNVIGVTKL